MRLHGRDRALLAAPLVEILTEGESCRDIWRDNRGAGVRLPETHAERVRARSGYLEKDGNPCRII